MSRRSVRAGLSVSLCCPSVPAVLSLLLICIFLRASWLVFRYERVTDRRLRRRPVESRACWQFLVDVVDRSRSAWTSRPCFVGCVSLNCTSSSLFCVFLRSAGSGSGSGSGGGGGGGGGVAAAGSSFLWRCRLVKC